MKTQLTVFSLVLMMVLQGLTSATAQNYKNDMRESFAVVPAAPSPYDSIFVVYTYISTDGCPDYYLAIDSVVGNKIYVERKDISPKPEFCTMVIRQFTTRLNLGVLDEGTEIYFRGKPVRKISYKCEMNMLGVVVEGIDGCTGELFIRQIFIETVALPPHLFKIQPIEGKTLKPGDRVKFGAYKLPNPPSVLCPIVGVAACYELLAPVNAYTITGKALAGEQELLSGRAVLIRKDLRRTWGVSTIYNGKYVFANVPEGVYTVYVMPERLLYRQFMPTFYVDKLRINEADFFELKDNIDNLTVLLRQVQRKDGGGRIHGNITFENENLRDSLMAERNTDPKNKRSASNIPVMLIDSRNQPVAWTTTDNEGDYEFSGLAMDKYRVVPEAVSAEGEKEVDLSSGTQDVTADLQLKSPTETTSTPTVKDKLITVYPNPFSRELYVNAHTAGYMQVYNAVGQLIHRHMLNEGQNVLDLSSLQQGVLLLKTPDGNFRVLKK
jgi:hypothetical protein